MTIQGQTITSVFGNKDQAKYNFEQLLTAGIENEVFKNHKKDLTEKERTLIEELAELSYVKYVDLKEKSTFCTLLARNKYASILRENQHRK
ncbi:MAG: phosphoenolpyruvate carboxylase [Cloacibacterium normanense]